MNRQQRMLLLFATVTLLITQQTQAKHTTERVAPETAYKCNSCRQNIQPGNPVFKCSKDSEWSLCGKCITKKYLNDGRLTCRKCKSLMEINPDTNSEFIQSMKQLSPQDWQELIEEKEAHINDLKSNQSLDDEDYAEIAKEEALIQNLREKRSTLASPLVADASVKTTKEDQPAIPEHKPHTLKDREKKVNLAKLTYSGCWEGAILTTECKDDNYNKLIATITAHLISDDKLLAHFLTTPSDRLAIIKRLIPPLKKAEQPIEETDPAKLLIFERQAQQKEFAHNLAVAMLTLRLKEPEFYQEYDDSIKKIHALDEAFANLKYNLVLIESGNYYEDILCPWRLGQNPPALNSIVLRTKSAESKIILSLCLKAIKRYNDTNLASKISSCRNSLYSNRERLANNYKELTNNIEKKLQDALNKIGEFKKTIVQTITIAIDEVLDSKREPIYLYRQNVETGKSLFENTGNPQILPNWFEDDLAKTYGILKQKTFDDIITSLSNPKCPNHPDADWHTHFCSSRIKVYFLGEVSGDMGGLSHELVGLLSSAFFGPQFFEDTDRPSLGYLPKRNQLVDDQKYKKAYTAFGRFLLICIKNMLPARILLTPSCFAALTNQLPAEDSDHFIDWLDLLYFTDRQQFKFTQDYIKQKNDRGIEALKAELRTIGTIEDEIINTISEENWQTIFIQQFIKPALGLDERSRALGWMKEGLYGDYESSTGFDQLFSQFDDLNNAIERGFAVKNDTPQLQDIDIVKLFLSCLKWLTPYELTFVLFKNTINIDELLGTEDKPGNLKIKFEALTPNEEVVALCVQEAIKDYLYINRDNQDILSRVIAHITGSTAYSGSSQITINIKKQNGAIIELIHTCGGSATFYIDSTQDSLVQMYQNAGGGAAGAAAVKSFMLKYLEEQWRGVESYNIG